MATPVKARMRDNPMFGLTIALGVIVLVVCVLALWIGSSFANRQNRLLEIQQIAISISERADCRENIEATIDEVDRIAENLDRSINQQRTQVQIDQLAGRPLTEAQIQRAIETEDRAEIAIRAVESLPHLAEAVDNGWNPSEDVQKTLPGIPSKIAPCPVVPRAPVTQ